MSESKAKRTRKPKVVETDLKDIHLVFDEEGRKIVLAEVKVNAEGTGILPITNIKDVTDQFKNTGLMVSAFVPVNNSVILSGESNDDTYVYTIFIKTPKAITTQVLIEKLAESGLIELKDQVMPVEAPKPTKRPKKSK